MKSLRLLVAAAIVLCLVGLPKTHAAKKPKEQLQTGVLGGVACPSAEELAAMQKGQYIFHARDGKVTKVQVQKSRLPHDPEGHVQIVWTAQSPQDRNTVYVNQGSIMNKTTDGGITWTSYPRDWPGPDGNGSFQILGDGTFIVLAIKNGYAPQLPRTAEVMTSHDEGRTWKKISEFPIDVSSVDYPTLMVGIPLFRLPDDTLLYSVAMYNHTPKDGLASA